MSKAIVRGTIVRFTEKYKQNWESKDISEYGQVWQLAEVLEVKNSAWAWATLNVLVPPIGTIEFGGTPAACALTYLIPVSE